MSIFFDVILLYMEREKMWYVLRTIAGTDEKNRNMIDDHIERSLFTRCIAPYQRMREMNKDISVYVYKLMFFIYVFVEIDRIKDIAKQLQRYPGKTFFYRKVISSARSMRKRCIS